MSAEQTGDDDVLTVPEAAALLRVSDETVRRAFDAGQLAGYKTSPGPGGWRRIYRASVDDLLRRRASGGDVAPGR